MDRIILLMKHEKKNALLVDWLGMNYQVLQTDTGQSLDFSFDLGIVDAPALQVVGESIKDRKRADVPVFLPFLLVTSREKVVVVETHLGETVDDIAWTPLNRIELQVRTANLLRARHFSQETQRLSITDTLTGVNNRRHFFSLGEREQHRARRFRRPLALIVLEVDHFQRINLTYGYEAGDLVLRTVAQRTLHGLRTIDILGRLEGEKFVILLADIDLAGAVKVAERMRREVSREPVETDQGAVSVTISLGVSSAVGNSLSLEELLERADAALCAAKQAGANRMMVEGQPKPS